PRDESSETSESSELSELSEISERSEVPSPPLTCITPAGYSFRQGLDAFGNNISCGSGQDATVNASFVANICSTTPQCVAFVIWLNPEAMFSSHCLKSAVGELIESPDFDGPCRVTSSNPSSPTPFAPDPPSFYTPPPDQPYNHPPPPDPPFSPPSTFPPNPT
ncbi:hypothetical protein HaLaN_04934, partial [Haematococcus lacustris]